MSKANLYYEKLDDIFGGDKALIYNVCQSFLKHGKNYQLLIDEAHKNKDGDELKRIAHSLKSSFIMFGDQEAQKAAIDLEKIGEKNLWENSDKKISKFNKLLQDAIETSQKIIDSSFKEEYEL